MRKRIPILKKFRLELTKDDFYVVVANDISEGYHLLKSETGALDEYEVPEKLLDCAAICVGHTEEAIVAVIFSFSDLQAYYICHEVSHATHAVLQYVGIPLTSSTDEVYAYHNDMLFRFCTQFMKENKLKIKL